MKISDLKQDAQNANRGTKRGREAVASSLKQFGAGRSVLIDRDGNLIAGNKTAAEASAAGIHEVIVVESDGTKLIAVKRTDLSIDSPEARGLAIADNRVGQLGLEWDSGVLKDLIPDLDLQGYFSTEEIAELLGATNTLNGYEDDAPDAPAPEAAETVPGEIIILGLHRLLCGDSTSVDDITRLLDGTKPDMVNTDPPYGISIVKGSGKIGSGGKFRGSVGHGKIIPANVYAPVIGDDSTDTAVAAYNICAAMGIPVLIFWGGNHYANKLPPSSCWIVWDKQNNGNDFADAELAWTNQKTAVRICVHQWNGMLKASERGERRCHPTQKPVALAEWCFEKYGKECKTVLDLFGGSGSTLIACEKTNRTCYMMEMSPEYCDVITKRWEKLTGKTAVRVKP
jgi:16S rRNA G966 N2-methylase RsmD